MNTSQHLSDDLLNSWIDGTATTAEKSIIKEHLSHCAPCRKELDSLNAVKTALSALSHSALPRSFHLTTEQAQWPTPIHHDEESKTSNVVQLLPIVRMLTIAAAIAFLVLGGSLVFGPVSGTLNNDSDQAAQLSETDESSDASQNQNPAPPMAAFPGEVVDQGEAASSITSLTDSLDEQAVNANTQALDADEGDEGLSSLELSTLTTASLALILLGLWALLSRMNRPQPARSSIDRS